jgi:putative transposase
MKARSFTLTPESLSLCIAKEFEEETKVTGGAVGTDRNLNNVAVGDEKEVTIYDPTKIIEIGNNTRSIISSFKRDEVRIRKKIASKYGRRKKDRVRQILNRVSKEIVTQARGRKKLMVFEDITGLRNLYKKGDGQGRVLQIQDEQLVPIRRAGEAGRVRSGMGGW